MFDILIEWAKNVVFLMHEWYSINHHSSILKKQKTVESPIASMDWMM